jgi:hypothetical protein
MIKRTEGMGCSFLLSLQQLISDIGASQAYDAFLHSPKLKRRTSAFCFLSKDKGFRFEEGGIFQTEFCNPF